MNGYDTCKKNTNQLCSIRIEEADNYKCNCELSVGYQNPRKCNDYRSKFKRPTNVTHELTMKVRIDWEADGKYEIFNSLFANQIYNLLSPGLRFKFPEFALPEFTKYEQNVFESYENIDFYKRIQEDKLRRIFMNGLKEFVHLEECGIYTIYPEFSFDRTAFKPTRLINTVFDVKYLISCEKSIDKNNLLSKFTNEHLQSDYVENYLYLKHTGYVLPDSISLH